MEKEKIKELLKEAQEKEDERCSSILGEDEFEQEPITYDIVLKIKRGSDEELFQLSKKNLSIFSLKYLLINIEKIADQVDFDGLLEREQDAQRELEFQKEQKKASKK